MELITNHQAVNYAMLALEQLKKEGKDINVQVLKWRMFYLMNEYPGDEINEKVGEIIERP